MPNLEMVETIIREVPRDFHISGSLSPPVLRRIAELHQEVGGKVSAETGCGLTTLILSQLSSSHTSFTVDFGDSLPNTRGHAMFNAPTTEFVVNPTQVSLPRYEFRQPLDFVIIDGPHAYPFPDLEYFYFYPMIRTGGILVVDDIHIPTIGHMYDFLRDDQMWEHLGDVETTAFFKRTNAPLLDPYGDDWPMQRYNRRYFEYPHALNPLFGEDWQRADFGPGGASTPPGAKFHSAKSVDELLNARVSPLEQEIADLQRQIAQARLESEHLRAARDDLLSSTSWRITAPMRAIKNAFR